MSSAGKAATPATRRNPSRAAKARRAVTDAPRRARSLPLGNSAGGAQADHHEAADPSDHGTSDGDSSGAGHALIADSVPALGADAHSDSQAIALSAVALDGEAAAAVRRVQDRIQEEQATQNSLPHVGNAREQFGRLGIRLASPRAEGSLSAPLPDPRVGSHGKRDSRARRSTE